MKSFVNFKIMPGSILDCIQYTAEPGNIAHDPRDGFLSVRIKKYCSKII